MVNNYQARIDKDRDYFDEFQPEVKSILAQYVIRKSSKDEDHYKNSDLVTDKGDYSVRIRRPHYYPKEKHLFTLRSWRHSGSETEIDKVMRGCTKLIFYGFLAQDESSLCAWFIGSMDVFRQWFKLMIEKNNKLPGNEYPNADGLSRYREFNIKELPPEFIVSSKGILP